ncbi:MAG: tetratricopeptide repeat protein, partial [Candidatus Zixiibacteriota bacterium]
DSLIGAASLSEASKDSVRFYLGAAYFEKGELKKAEAVFTSIYERNKASGFDDLLAFYYRTKNYPQVERLVSDWLAMFPNDPRAPDMRSFLVTVRQESRADTAGGSTPSK